MAKAPSWQARQLNDPVLQEQLTVHTSHMLTWNCAFAVRSQANGPLARPGQASLWDVTDITDYSLLGEAGLLPGAKAPFLLPGGAMTISPPPINTACTGMILHPAFERPPQVHYVEITPLIDCTKMRFKC